MASCVPLSRLEMMVNDLVLRRSTRVVWPLTSLAWSH
jgi:hypothetical protein